jgi:formylglycine-generating enzyme required for sulfatase activity
VGSLARESYYDNSAFNEFPVVNVTWYQACAYAEWVGGRLPSEAEWEYAARGPQGRRYPWGDTEPNEYLLNFNNIEGDVVKVGSYSRNRSWCGAMDMSGNVWEWTQSLFVDYPYDPINGREDLTAEGTRVLRGGSSTDQWWDVRSAVRSDAPPSGFSANSGFRVAMDAD